YLPPKLDLNNIKIRATPTNPSSPNGETLFEMWLMIKDTSSYNGHASGFSNGTYTLRDPQGKEFSFSMQGDLGNNYYSIAPDSSIYGYKSYYLKTLLPVGSAPGIWGVSSILLEDHAVNKKYYSFVEIVRFDVELSKILQVTPYVEIFDKKVNLYNKDSASVRFGCKSCATQLYRLNMYSDMGGENIVLEGKMSADTITINKINLSGVVDGALYATVMMLDSTQALIGIGKASCTKDAKIPTNYSLTSNRSLIGKSNLDSFIVSIKSVELNSTSKISLVQKSISSTSGAGFKIGDSVIIQNSYKDTTTAITSVILNRFSDGAIDIKLTSVDSMGNIGNIVMTTIYKDSQSPIISFQKDSTSGTFIYTSIRSNKNIFNKPINTDFTINSGAITSIDKINNQLFKITINRNCNDTVAIKLNQSVLLDTVGNSNTVMNTTVIDKISATAPLITSTNNATSFCIGDTIQLTASSLSGNAWYKDGTVFGATTSIKVFASGTYFDTLTNAIGCKAGSVKLVIVANPLPAKPSISWNGTKFSTTASGMIYQWLLNNSAVVGATSDTLKPAASGIYKIRITDQNGCKNLSDSIQYTVTAINNTSAIPPSNIAKLYPTPATTELLINFNQTPSIKLEFEHYLHKIN
ncbi:MAG: hypothetical protein NTZ19_08145, partial [Bacteroidetes bacterium]|nr:hypothetical protein [Bacteroidota bacterium]